MVYEPASYDRGATPPLPQRYAVPLQGIFLFSGPVFVRFFIPWLIKLTLHYIIYPYKTERFDSALFRARTGHTYCRDHLYRFKIVKDRSCRYCNANCETLEHLILHCPYFQIYEDVKNARLRFLDLKHSRRSIAEYLWCDPSIITPLLHAVLRHAQCF